MTLRPFLKTACLLLSAFLFLYPGFATAGKLASGFESPPNAARPLVWWHWMNGNVTREGIHKDLEWLHSVGIGGVHYMDVGLDSPQLVDVRIPFMSSQWKDLFSDAVAAAHRNNMEFGVFSSSGWSLTGGPWVKPMQAMKKLVWSETVVEGGRRFNATLPPLPRATGPFQKVLAPDKFLAVKDITLSNLEFSADQRVVAYRVPETLATEKSPTFTIKSSSGDIPVQDLSDRDATTGLKLAAAADGSAPWVELVYERPVDVYSVTVSARPVGTVVRLEVSNDGKRYQKLPAFFFLGPTTQNTISIKPRKAQFFRFSFQSPQKALPGWRTAVPGVANDGLKALFGDSLQPAPLFVQDLVIERGARVHKFEKKAGFEIAPNYYSIASPAVPEELTVPTTDVVDLTSMVGADGSLDWKVPTGQWHILRLGYSLVGSRNHAASPEGAGLEVDKLNGGFVRDYIQQYLRVYKDAMGKAGKEGRITTLMVDSFEVGPQNWTPGILEQFERLRGYDPLPWLPALTGVVVESAQESDRFLWDYRRTIGQLLATEHYQTLATVAKEQDLAVYGEALEGLRFSLGDDMEMRRYTQVPTGAIWAFPPELGPDPNAVGDIRGAASIAHIYGQNLVAAESLTTAQSPWAYSPRDLKPIMDYAFSLGLNKPILHSAVHQPRDDYLPGMTLSIFGQNFNRLDTWAALAGPWVDYLSRCSYLLQQGRYVADIAYFYGEEAPLTALYGHGTPPEIPPGYGFDFVNSDVLLNELSVEEGALVTASGMRYKILMLGGSSKHMTVAILRRIREFVKAGITVVGHRPIATPSLSDAVAQHTKIVDELWGNDDTDVRASNVKPGEVFLPGALQTVLQRLGPQRDFEYVSSEPDTDSGVVFVHRKLPGIDIYFVMNPGSTDLSGTARFRVVGRAPQFWSPASGARDPASFTMENGFTQMEFPLLAYESRFIVFTEKTDLRQRLVPEPVKKTLAALSQDWTLDFPMKRDGGGSPSLLLAELIPWDQHSSPAVRYFSGTATYTKDFNVPQAWLDSPQRLYVELGDVRDVAKMRVNGHALGVLWTPPYRIEVTDVLVPGENTLEIEVTNLWVNRLIGDQQHGAAKTTNLVTAPYEADAPLRRSGLLGPVVLEAWAY